MCLCVCVCVWLRVLKCLRKSKKIFKSINPLVIKRSSWPTLTMYFDLQINVPRASRAKKATQLQCDEKRKSARLSLISFLPISFRTLFSWREIDWAKYDFDLKQSNYQRIILALSNSMLHPVLSALKSSDPLHTSISIHQHIQTECTHLSKKNLL